MPSKKRQKIDASKYNVKDIERMSGEFTESSLEYARIKADMDLELDAIREKYAPELDNLSLQIESRKNIILTVAENLREKLLPGAKKSVRFARAILTCRTSPFSVRQAPKVKVEATLEALPKKYQRIRKEVDKEALLRDREKITQEQRDEWGIRFVQKEEWGIEPVTDQSPDSAAA